MERAIYSGLFNDEVAQRYLRTIVLLAEKGFFELYEKCMPGNPNNYRKGLERVTTWSNNVMEGDLKHIQTEYPDFDSLYDHCFISYVKNVRGINFKTHKLMVNVPSSIEFVRLYFLALARHPNIMSGDFFKENNVVSTRVTCMDCARDAFFALDVIDNVQLELRSQISAVAPHKPPSNVNVPSEITLDKATEVDLKNLEVRPDDSVSNVGRNHTHLPTPSTVSEKTSEKKKQRTSDDAGSVALTGVSRSTIKKAKSVVSSVVPNPVPRNDTESQVSKVVSEKISHVDEA